MHLGFQEMLPLILIVLLLFGAARLPKLARSLREARDEFQKGSTEGDKPAEASQEKPPDSA
jgi:sec-independent protein translocase protein TatA